MQQDTLLTDQIRIKPSPSPKQQKNLPNSEGKYRKQYTQCRTHYTHHIITHANPYTDAASTLHCPKNNNLNLRMKTKLATAGTDPAVYVWRLFT